MIFRLNEMYTVSCFYCVVRIMNIDGLRMLMQTREGMMPYIGLALILCNLIYYIISSYF